MRPLFSLAHVVGLIMLGYAVGVLSTPGSGATDWLRDNTPLTTTAIALTFAICGGSLLITKPKYGMFSLLTTPLLMYSLAAMMVYLQGTDNAFTIMVGHLGLWLVIQAALIDAARRGPPPQPPEGGTWTYSSQD